MFYYSATEKHVAGKTTQIFNYGNCKRDFTYIDDIVEGVYRVMQGAPEKSNGEDCLPLPPYAVYYIGGGTPENLIDYISTLQEELVRTSVLPEDYESKGQRELVPCCPRMSLSPTLIAKLWKMITDSDRRLGSEKA